MPAPNSQITQDVLEQTEMIFQVVRKNAMQAYIKYTAYYVKEALKTSTNKNMFMSYS